MPQPKATAKVVQLALTTTVILTGFQLSPIQPVPIQINPIQTQPIQTQPIQTQPIQTQPIQTQPIQAQPIQINPIQTQPIQAQPIRLNPVLLNQILLSPFPSEAIAHTVETAEDVGATIHIEPNDTPRAGEKSLAWFALTRRGGELIPLANCSCELAVYALPYQKGDLPLLSPPLISVNAENYQDIPGANITFPDVGAYRLVLSGEPQASAPQASALETSALETSALEDFTPFELDFEVTVAAGQSVPDSTAESTQPTVAASSDPQSPKPEGSTPGAANRGIAIASALVILAGLTGLMKLLDMWRSHQKS